MTRPITVSCSIFLLLFSAFAHGAEKNYGRFSMGLTIPEASYLTDPSFESELLVKTKYMTGLSAAVAMGHEFEKLRIEGETSYQKNDFDTATFSGTEVALDGEASVLTFLANAYFDYKNRSDFTPYLGGGIGLSRIFVKNLLVPGAGIACWSDEDYVFTYQLGIGVGYSPLDGVSIDLNYRYFVPSDPDFNTVQAEFSSHNIFLGLRVYF